MADSKRSSMAGKVATPKMAGTSTPAAQPLPDNNEALGKAIGARIKVTTAAPAPKTYDGTLFTVSPILNVIAINTRAALANPSTDVASQPGDYHIIPISQIQSFQVVSLASGGSGSESSVENAKPSVGLVDTKRLRRRLDERVAAVQEQEKNQGKGVTKEAQAIFDSFRRMHVFSPPRLTYLNMPVRWHNQEMIVHEAIIIAPPYRSEDCKGAKDKQEVLSRVRKVLE
ncbi:hypothetical protein BAUCODRAFT_50250, partial [Baudoinia panamericana UAMH 10762]